MLSQTKLPWLVKTEINRRVGQVRGNQRERAEGTVDEERGRVGGKKFAVGRELSRAQRNFRLPDFLLQPNFLQAQRGIGGDVADISDVADAFFRKRFAGDPKGVGVESHAAPAGEFFQVHGQWQVQAVVINRASAILAAGDVAQHLAGVGRGKINAVVGQGRPHSAPVAGQRVAFPK